MQNYFISKFLSITSFNKILFSKFEAESKQLRGYVIANFLKNSNKNNYKTKVHNHCLKMIIIFKSNGFLEN